MTLIDFLTSPWALIPEKLLEMQAIYATHLRGEKIDIEAIEAKLGRPLANDQQDYEIREGGIAVLPVSGVISPKANMFVRISGGTSAQMLVKQIDSIRAEASMGRVKGAVLDFDTPGGSVFGIPALAAAIRELSDAMPTVSVSTGMMASAGYWTGSAANAVYASGETDMIGSIGVVMTHNYNPRGAGQTTEITAGKYKRIASDNAPLSTEGRAYLQGQVDEIYRSFVNAVAGNRRTTAERVLEHMADGRVFVGKQAADAGLIDGFATVDQMVERMATDPSKFTNRRKAVFALGGLSAAGAAAVAGDPQTTDEPVPPVASENQPVEVNMTPQELAADFAAKNPEAAALIRKEGATAELQRVQDVRAAALPGHEALIEQLSMDGKTTGAEAAMAVVAAERNARNAAAKARLEDAPAPVANPAAENAKPAAAQASAAASYAAPAGYQVDAAAAELDAKAKAYMQANPGTDYVAAVKAVQNLEA